MSLVRLHKLLAQSGVASRRKAEDLIAQGRVRVDGQVVAELGTSVDPDQVSITVDKKPVMVMTDDVQEKVYFLLNKPPQVMTTVKDDRDRRCVMDLVKGATMSRIFPVGRLDYDTSGALLLTNDGELSNQLTHPRYKVPKTYLAKVKGTPDEEGLEKLRRGIYLEDGPTGKSEIQIIGKARVNTWLQVVVTEGRNRLIRRMFWRIKHPVAKLVRTHFAGISIDGLREGDYRLLTKREVIRLQQLCRSAH